MRMTIKVVLTQNVPGVGKKGDILNVRRGYARNFFISKRLARVAREEDAAAARAQEAAIEKQRAEAWEKTKDAKERLFKKYITLQLPANDQGTLYRAVAPKDIVEAVYATYGVNVPVSAVVMETIKSVGSHGFKVALKDQGEVAMKARVKALL